MNWNVSNTLLRTISIAAFVALSISLSLADSNRAFKLLEKGEYQKLHEHLSKSLEKDSINAGANYVFSLLYLTPQYDRYSIDTSWMFITRAIRDMQYQEDKELERLEKLLINDSTINIQKKEVEKAAYERAKELNTIQDYDYFLKHFPGSVHDDSAVFARNQLAYGLARNVNTLESYRYFLDTYPKAIQYRKAEAKYDSILFVSETKEGTLERYNAFLENYPKTPYRQEAIRNIFEISTADNRYESYIEFISRYPIGKLKTRAVGVIYHCYRDKFSDEAFDRAVRLGMEDSILKVMEMDKGFIFPMYENEKYGFFHANGTKLLDFNYLAINEKYYCGNVLDDVLQVVLDSQKTIISRQGAPIFRGDFDDVKDAGCGVLVLESEGKYGAIYKTGAKILDIDYDRIELIAHAFLKIFKNEKAGLVSLTGRQILPPEYDDIVEAGQFVLVLKDGKYAPQNVENLGKAANHEEPVLAFEYDDYELVYGNRLLLFNNNQETIIDQELNKQLPLDNQNFYEFFNGWAVKKNRKYRLYDSGFQPLSDQEFDQVNIRTNRVTLKKNGKWAVYNQGEGFPNKFEYDSIRFLSEEIGILQKEKKMLAIFKNDAIVDITYSKSTKLLKSADIEENPAQYLQVKTPKGYFRIFNDVGKAIIYDRFTSIKPLGKEYLVVEKNGKEGMYHHNGDLALNFLYSSIANYHNGYVSTLLRGKFGIYNHQKKLLLSAKYDKQLIPFGKKYFIGYKDNKYGLVDLDNEEVSGFIFDKIESWNDSVAFVKDGSKWKLYDIQRKMIVYQGIDKFEYLKQGDEEKIVIITMNGQDGVYSNKKGEIINASFNDIINLGSSENPVYMTEKSVFEADIYVILYYDAEGNLLKKQVYNNQEEYEKIHCG